MKKNLAALVLVTLFTVACNPGPSTNPTSSTSPSGSPSASVQPSTDPASSATPSVQPSGAAPVAITCNPEPTLTVGQEFDKTIFSQLTCNADAKVGSKWTYSTSAMGASFDASVQILSMSGGMVTVRTETMVNGKKETKDSTSSSASGYADTDQDSLKFVYQGKEDVTVPAGSYPQSYKITASKTQSGMTVNLTYYISRKVGAVKVISEMPNMPVVGTVTTEVVLKEFLK